MSDRMFPIQDAEAIPWAVIAPCERQCQRNHGGQTLEEIAKRGGLGAAEACDILLGLRWSTTRPADAIVLLRNIVKDRWYLPEIEKLRLRVNQVESWLEEKCFEIAELKEKIGELTGKKYQAMILCGPCGKVVQDGDPGHEKSGYSYCEKCAPTEENEEE